MGTFNGTDRTAMPIIKPSRAVEDRMQRGRGKHFYKHLIQNPTPRTCSDVVRISVRRGGGPSVLYKFSVCDNKISRNHDLHWAEWNRDSESAISRLFLEVRLENENLLN